jgi:pyruvate,water dikinase
MRSEKLSDTIISIDSIEPPQIQQVGGKGASLIRLTQAGFNVPGGFVLSVEFFNDWISQVIVSDAWQQMLLADPLDLVTFTGKCRHLKAYAESLEFTSKQLHLVNQSIRKDSAYAVRSSSPEEDLVDSSFAGLYETLLDVNANQIFTAIRTCFASCLDSRVFVYKHKLGMIFDSPRIAVVVQNLIPSEVSGVAFSLNPLNNDFDETVVNATFGLGEALVSGEITPDSWTLNNVTHEVIKFNLGSKGENQSNEACLDDHQIKLVSQATCAIEEHYQQPMDIEWAFCKGEFFVLQARPITTYIPITKEMMTEPGERRVLYMDESLADGITISGPVSTLTNDYFMYIIKLFIRHLNKNLNLDLPPKQNLIVCTDIRYYTNMTVMARWRDIPSLAKMKKMIDVTYADILETCDLSEYTIEKAKFYEKLWLIPFIFRIGWVGRLALKSALSAIFRQKKFQLNYTEKLAEFDEFLRLDLPKNLLIDDFLLHYYMPFQKVSQETSMPGLILYSLRGTEALNKLIDAEAEQQVQLVEAIKSGSDDMVMIMGLKIYELSTLIEPAEFDDIEALAQRIRSRVVNAEFLDAWDRFMVEFGCRGPLEMDLAQPKYSDDPTLLLKQMATIIKSKQAFDPREHHKQTKGNRHKAYLELKELLPKKKRKKLDKAYKNVLDFEHSREIPKDHLVTVQKRFREYLLQQANEWVEQGRLNSVEEIFDLKLQEIKSAQQQSDFNLRTLLDNRDPYVARAKRVRHFPHAIDSRGRILRPEAEQVPGELSGQPVSSGITSGPVKVMHDPFEKEIEPGDVLVAYTTDPGWTPLFINAAAVLLEVGGELQHGALVAREYGKPCVAGIVRLTQTLVDGQMVEVNGNNGQVRLLDS